MALLMQRAATPKPDPSPAPAPAQPMVAQAPTVQAAEPAPRTTATTADIDGRVARLRKALADVCVAVAALQDTNFHYPTQDEIAGAAPSQLVTWANTIAINLGCEEVQA